MTRLLFAVAGVLLPLTAAADEVVLRSGEHAGFSRIVLEFSERPRWSLEVEDGRARIVLAQGDWTFDASRVFARIPRTRIAAVEGRPDGLDLTLGCACPVTAFEVRDAALVIDVLDPAAAGDVPDVAAPSGDGSGRSETAPPVVVAAAPLPLGPPAGPFQESAAALSAAAAIPRAPRPDIAQPPAREAAPRAGAAPDRAVNPVLTEVVEGIARAATQGVLRLAPEAERDGGSQASGPDAATPANLRLRLADEETWQLPEPRPESGCRGDAAYDLAAWGPGDRSPADAIAERRAALAPDLEIVDEDRAVELARLYVSLGFGAEARAVLAALAPRHPDAALLQAMADVIDGTPPSPDVFESEAPCPGRAQLWQALATAVPADPQAVKVAVAELPLVLRRHLGPRLIDIYLGGGDVATAESIRSTIDRAAGPHGAPFDLAAARLDLGREAAAGLSSIEELASDPSPASDEALILLLEAARETGRAVDPASIALAELRAEDLRGTPEGARLERGLVHAHLLGGAAGEAVRRLRSAIGAGALQAGDAAALAEVTLSELARSASDAEFLVHAAALRQAIPELVRGHAAGELVAARLLDLGLPELARGYLAPEAGQRPETRTLAARLELESGNPDGALSLLAGADDPGPEARAVMDAALRALGRGEQAAAPAPLLSGGDGAPPNETRTAGPGGTSPRALVAASETARAEIAARLAETPSP